MLLLGKTSYMKDSENSTSIYIHWPYCELKCPYCDFNSHVAKSEIEYAGWLSAYKKEIKYWFDKTSYKNVSSIFFGGGTPSLMPVNLVSEVIDFIIKLWQSNGKIEITLEANPSSAEITKFADLSLAGVNRISVGVQSFIDSELRFLGRLHDRKSAIKAVETANKCFSSYSFDLIYALPSQALSDLERNLSEASYYIGNHISCYQLTIEPNTAFVNDFRKGLLKPIDNDMAADMYELVGNFCSENGLMQYETSNYATPDFESQHNLNYWRYGSYIGIGPGAHGRILLNNKLCGTQNHRSPDKCLRHWTVSDLNTDKENSICRIKKIETKEQKEEHLLVNLRLREGVNILCFEKRYGSSIWDIVDENKVIELSREGIIKEDDLSKGVLKLVSQLRINSVLGYIIKA